MDFLSIEQLCDSLVRKAKQVSGIAKADSRIAKSMDSLQRCLSGNLLSRVPPAACFNCLRNRLGSSFWKANYV